MADLKPCPFCGVVLTPNDDRSDLYVRRYGTRYEHPENGCYLSGYDVAPSEVADWERRTAGVLGTPGDQLKEPK